MNTAPASHRAKPGLLLAVAGLWGGLNTYFAPRYVDMVREAATPAVSVLAGVLVLWIVFSSFYACFHGVSFLFSLVLRIGGKPVPRCRDVTPPAALLYPCRNDFKEKSVLSLLGQDYSDFHVFILDDSTLPEERAKAEALQKDHPDRITVIRRADSRGFKAGNLNQALEGIHSRFAYFAVADADEMLPPTFLSETVAIAEADPEIGFVQASHRQYGETDFAQKTGDGIDLHWDYYLPARNRFGFVYFYGHGALIRTEAWRAAGGFPEVVSEDIALAVKIREAGFRGYFAKEIVCLEETPPTYNAFRRRNGKVLRGTLEFLFRCFPSFWKAKNVSLAEKLDLLIASSVMYLTIPFLGFLFLLHFVLPFLTPDAYSFTFTHLPDAEAGYLRTAMGVFRPLWGWDALLFTLFTIFAPLCYLIPNLLRSPGKVTLFIWRIAAVQLSATLQAGGETFRWLTRRQASFEATSDREGTPTRRRLPLETFFGIGFLAASFVTGSLCLMAVGFSLLLTPLFMSKNLKGHWRVAACMVPMGLTIIAFSAIPYGLLGATGVFAGIALAHH